MTPAKKREKKWWKRRRRRGNDPLIKFDWGKGGRATAAIRIGASDLPKRLKDDPHIRGTSVFRIKSLGACSVCKVCKGKRRVLIFFSKNWRQIGQTTQDSLRQLKVSCHLLISSFCLKATISQVDPFFCSSLSRVSIFSNEKNSFLREIAVSET